DRPHDEPALDPGPQHDTRRETVTQFDLGDHHSRLVGRDRGDGRAVGGEHLTRAGGGQVHDAAAALHRRDPGHGELLQVLVGATDVRVVGLEHVHLGAVVGGFLDVVVEDDVEADGRSELAAVQRYG